MWTFVTTTAYGSWLPGDARGWVMDGRVLPGDPDREASAARRLRRESVRFTPADQESLFRALCDAAKEFGYHLTDVTVESWHLHWIVQHEDLIETMVGRLKTRMRQAIGRGRIWTEGYCANALADEHAVTQARAYIAHHPGCRMVRGVVRARESSGRS